MKSIFNFIYFTVISIIGFLIISLLYFVFLINSIHTLEERIKSDPHDKSATEQYQRITNAFPNNYILKFIR